MKNFGLVMGLVAVGALVGCGDDGGTGGGGQGGNASGGGDDPTTTTTTTSSSSSSSSGSGGEGGGTAAATCASYCDAITTNCTAGNLQYASEAQCLTACAAFEQGEPGATSGNTLECRQYHADFAATSANAHCGHAGPLGTDGCEGANGSCDGFCAIAMAECDTEFETLQACLDDCGDVPDDVAYNQSVTTGDNLACRMYHLSVAFETPTPHCDHIQSTDATCTDAN